MGKFKSYVMNNNTFGNFNNPWYYLPTKEFSQLAGVRLLASPYKRGSPFHIFTQTKA